MSIKINLTLILILILNFNLLLAQNLENKLSKEQQTEDFLEFVKLLEETHVDAYKEIGGKVNFQFRIAEYLNKIPNLSGTRNDFAVFLTEFISYLKDNHTLIRNNSSKNNSNKQLPFFAKGITDGIYIQFTKENYKELYNAKILSINNTSIDSLIEKSKKLESYENISNLKNNLANQIVFYSSAKKLFPELTNSLKIKFISLNLDTLEKEINFYESTELNKMKWQKMNSNTDINNEGIFNFQFIDKEKQTMYFRLDEMFSQEVIEMMKAYKTENKNWIYSTLRYYPELKTIENKDEAVKKIPYFSEYFETMLSQMKKNKSEFLILDLSKNGGGYSEMAIPALYMLFGDECFSNKTDYERITKISELYLKKYNLTIDEFNNQRNGNYEIGDLTIPHIRKKTQTANDYKSARLQYFQSLEKNNFNWGKYIEDLDGEAIYSPKIIVLISSKTNSAAYHFLYNLHKLGNITTVGISPQQAGNTPMEVTNFTLSNSKLSGSISNSYQIMFPETDEKAKIFKPDFPLNWSDFQKTQGSRYTELEIAIELIENGDISSDK